jgi:transposase
LSWRKVGQVPAKADPEAQAAFLRDELRPRLEQAERGQRAVLFVDAAHFVFGPFLGHVWAAIRLFLPAPSGRQRYNVLGALNAVTHELTRVVNGTVINAEAVCELLRLIARHTAGPVTVVLDNAKYQRCGLVQELARGLGIELLSRPPYSPNLNLIERRWRFVKKECLAARCRADFAEFRAAIGGCLDELPTKHRTAMRSLLTLEFQTFEDVPVLAA